METLTKAQCEKLAGVQIGDLIIIKSYTKPEYASIRHRRVQGGSESETDMGGSEGSTSVEGVEEDVNADVNDSPESNEDDAEMSEQDEQDEDEQGSEDEHEDEDDDMDSEDREVALEPASYKVFDVSKDKNGTIVDIVLASMTYCLKPAEATSTTFHLYGRELVHGTTTTPVADDKLQSIEQIIDNRNEDTFIYLNCTGGDVVDQVIDEGCPAKCRDGWVATQQEMHEMVEENILTVTEHQPVCPVCIGKPLMLEYQSLREMLETAQGGMIDLGVVVEFHGRLNPRRRQLGYPFKQFDEREWGYLFDDMDREDDGSDGDGDGHNGNSDGWGYWPEALDPASCIVAKPASDAAIADLPRKPFSEVTKTGKDMECAVCKDTFTGEVIVAELPCGHFFCDSGCIEMWLKQFNNCPTCRAKIPSKEDEQSETEANGVVDSPVADDAGHTEMEEDGTEGTDADGEGDEKDDGDDDVVMADTEDEVAAA